MTQRFLAQSQSRLAPIMPDQRYAPPVGPAHTDVKWPAHGYREFSGVSWRNAPFCANQKLLIKLTFQCGNLLAERWLCDMQYFSSLGQATNIYNFYEVFQASEVHVASGFKSRPKCRHYLQPECKMLASSILALMRKLTNCQIRDYDRFVIGSFYLQSHSPAL